jgi:2-iminoacetate synthase
LLVAGESAPAAMKSIDYYVSSVRAIYSACLGLHRVRRVNVNCAPLTVPEFRKLKAAGIGTYQLFQETYHGPTYARVHPSGPKSDPDNRIDAIERAFKAGIDDVGVGVLYGLYDYRFETLGLLSHIEGLEKKFGVGPHTISVPRLEPAVGAEFFEDNPYRVADADFRKIVAVLRLAVPYTGIILSTREPAALRDELFSLGVSQISAASKTSPGGYAAERATEAQESQFVLSDRRSLDEVVCSLLKHDFVPSFCAACYRKQRTGEAFMELAKPGTIKGKCQMNALITLKEYLDDFASAPVRKRGYALIGRAKTQLDDRALRILERHFENIERGGRDVFV